MKEIPEKLAFFSKTILILLILIFCRISLLYARFKTIQEAEEFFSEGRLVILGLLVFFIAIGAYIVKPFWSKSQKAIGLSVFMITESTIIWWLLH